MASTCEAKHLVKLPPLVILKIRKSEGGNLHVNQRLEGPAAHLSSLNLEVALQLMAFFHLNPPWKRPEKNLGGWRWWTKKGLGNHLDEYLDMWSGFGSHEKDNDMNYEWQPLRETSRKPDSLHRNSFTGPVTTLLDPLKKVWLQYTYICVRMI